MSDINVVFADGVAEIVTEMETGRIVQAKNENARLPMASTTKIMTAWMICEDCDPNREIEVPRPAVGVEGSSVYLKENERIDIRDLLYGLMLRSGNDCAVALAIAHSGSVEMFVSEMNRRVADMGLNDTHFCNPHGLPNHDHYTTASELATISRSAMKNELFRTIVSTRNYHGKYRSFTNKNKLLGQYDGANGIKTGYTLAAGRCLVSSAERDGTDMICVVLNCPDMFERSEFLLNEALDRYVGVEIPRSAVFLFEGKMYRLAEPKKIVLDRTETIKFLLKECDEDDRVILRIYEGNDLIFSYFLDNIIGETN